jgi:hypothetical protein
VLCGTLVDDFEELADYLKIGVSGFIHGHRVATGVVQFVDGRRYSPGRDSNAPRAKGPGRKEEEPGALASWRE